MSLWPMQFSYYGVKEYGEMIGWVIGPRFDGLSLETYVYHKKKLHQLDVVIKTWLIILCHDLNLVVTQYPTWN